MTDGFITGMRGVYLVAAEITKRGFIVSPTSRSAMGADLLATDQQCKKAFSVQVKTNKRNASFWLVNKKAKEAVSDTRIYVFVNIINTKKDGERVEYFVVPSKQVARRGRLDGAWPSVYREDILKYENKWSAFGRPD